MVSSRMAKWKSWFTAFRIEPLVPASPAQRRAQVRAEHAVRASPALLVLFAAAHARVSPARRRAGAARAGAASKVALARNRRGAQASLPTKAAPAVAGRDRIVARRLLPLSAAGGYVPNTQPWPGARGQAVTPRPLDSRGRIRAQRRRCWCSSPPPALAARRSGASAVAARAGAASNVALVRNQHAVPRAGFPAIKGNAAREAAFQIEPSAPSSRSVSPPRGYDPNAQPAPRARAARRSQHLRQTGLTSRRPAQLRCARCRGFENAAPSSPRSVSRRAATRRTRGRRPRPRLAGPAPGRGLRALARLRNWRWQVAAYRMGTPPPHARSCRMHARLKISATEALRRQAVTPAQLRKMEAEAKQVYFSEPPEPLLLLFHRNHVREDCCAPRAVDAVAVKGSGLAQRQISEQVGFGGSLGSGRAVVRTRHKSVPAGNREEGKGDVPEHGTGSSAVPLALCRTAISVHYRVAARCSTLKPVRLRTA